MNSEGFPGRGEKFTGEFGCVMNGPLGDPPKKPWRPTPLTCPRSFTTYGGKAFPMALNSTWRSRNVKRGAAPNAAGDAQNITADPTTQERARIMSLPRYAPIATRVTR